MIFRNSFERRLFGVGVAYSAVVATILLLVNGHVFTSMDSTSHTYIAAAVVRNGVHSKFANIGTVWLPMLHILLAPLTLFKPLYSTGLAGTIVNGIATGGVLVYLSRIVTYITDRKDVLYGSIILFLSSGMTALYAATPMMEQLSIFFGLSGVYYFLRYWKEDSMPDFVLSGAFIFLGTLTRYGFWFVAAAFVVAMVTKELRRKRQHNLAFFHLPLWGGCLWFVWNGAIFGNPFSFFASKTMELSVWLQTSLYSRVLFLGVLLLIGGLSFLLPFFLTRKNAPLAIAPAVVYAMYVISYVGNLHGLLSNLRYGYVLFGLLLPSIVALRRMNKRKSTIVVALLVLSVIVSSGFVLTGVYSDFLGSPGVQELSVDQPELPNAVILLPIQGIHDMEHYPKQYLDAYDGQEWRRASRTPWNSNVDFVVIPAGGEGRIKDYRDSGPIDGFVWNFFRNESWRETFLHHFELVDNVESGRATYRLYKRLDASETNSTSARHNPKRGFCCTDNLARYSVLRQEKWDSRPLGRISQRIGGGD